jgi:hypothetical protein
VANPIGASIEHKFFTKDGMKKVKDFGANECIGFPVRTILDTIGWVPYGLDKGGSIDLSYDLGRLVGLYIDRGFIERSIDTPFAVCFTINTCELETIQKWLEPLGHLFDRMDISYRQPSNIAVIALQSYPLAQFFIDNYGEDNLVRFPHSWWNMGKDFVEGLVTGHLLHTCYSSQPTRCLMVKTHWVEIAVHLRDMLVALGYGWADLSWESGCEYGQDTPIRSYSVKLSGEGADRLALNIGVEYDACERLEYNPVEVKNGYAWVPVIDITPIGLQEVYDLEVNHPDHSYCLVQCASSNSEVAYWRAAKEISDGAMEGIPEEPGTEVYLESTAAGFGGYFHSMWQNACYIDEKPPATWNGYVRVFIPWFWEEQYQEPAPEGFELLEDEVEIQQLYDLNDDQIYWRRRKIANKEGNVAQFQREYPATPEDAFNSAVNNVLIPAELVVMARKRDKVKHYQPIGPVVMGVDVAREGDDSTAVVIRQGRVVLAYYRYDKLDNMEVAGRVIRTARQWKADFIGIDSTGGYGAGVYDRLAELGYGHMITAVNFASSAIDEEHYKNKRSEIWHAVKTWLETGAQLPDKDEFQQDLCSVTYKFDSSGDKLQLESKAEMKKRGIKSPDLGDALALTFFRPSESMGSKGQSFEPDDEY